jgi:predicted membrane channel-forming protein YqfA (hemolysin III family)
MLWLVTGAVRVTSVQTWGLHLCFTILFLFFLKAANQLVKPRGRPLAIASLTVFGVTAVFWWLVSAAWALVPITVAQQLLGQQ